MSRCDALVSYINDNNPDAKIVVFASYNPIKGMSFAFGDTEQDMGMLYEGLVSIFSFSALYKCSQSYNSVCVFVPDVRSAYSAALANGESADLLTFLSLYGENPDILEVSPECDQYIFDRMRTYVSDAWNNHKYSDKCDATCNRCGTKREITHQYYDCDDVTCNLCGKTREALSHVYDACDDAECALCQKERVALSHVYDDCDDVNCNLCGKVRTDLAHVYDDCEDVNCNLCGKTREALSHVFSGCEDTDCDICSKQLDAKGHQFGEWVTLKEASVDASGEERRECTACGHAETRSIPAVMPEDSGNAGGRIAIIVISSVVTLGAAGFCVYWFVLRKKKDQ